MRAASRIIATGSELVRGAVEDRNGPFLARALDSLGFPAESILLVGDDESAVAAALEAAAAGKAAAAIVTGGLGPTIDDVTRHAVARFAGLDLVEDPSLREKISSSLAGRGKSKATGDLRQALLPSGATVIPNPAGTADGFFLDARGMRVIALPGPPHELVATAGPGFEALAAALPDGARRAASIRLETFGLREAEVDALLDDARDTGASIGTLASGGCTTVVISAAGPGSGSVVAKAAAAARERLGIHVFGENGARIEEVLAAELMARRITVATAESCTGGLVASLLASVPGISASLLEGIVAYSNESKSRLLKVDPGLIESCGAVSPEVACAMAEGACMGSGADLGISTTGIAGPGGGTPDKPVGTVFIAVHWRKTSSPRRLTLPGMTRDWVRRISAMSALDLARRVMGLDQ